MDRFYVRRAVGDQGGGKDEIYWTAATGVGDPAHGTTFTSEKFDEVKATHTRSFQAGRRVSFDGPCRGFVGTTINCWEADQSNAAWFGELRKALLKAIDHIDRALELAEDIRAIKIPTWASVAWEIAKTFVVFMEVFRNYDDLSCSRTIGLGEQDLAVLSHRGQDTWHFNGDGHHELTVKYSGDKVPFPVGTLEYAVHTGNGWSSPVPLPFKSMTAPALASYDGKLYAAFVRPDRRAMWTRLEGQVWREPQPFGVDTTYYAPALGVVRGKLYYAVTGEDRALYTRSFTETEDWSGWTKLYGFSDKAPMLGFGGDRLWLTFVGVEGDVFSYDQTGDGWSGHHASNLPWVTDRPVACADSATMTWRVCRGTGGRVHTATHTSNRNWVNRGEIRTWTTPNGVALAKHGSNLWIFLRDGEGYLRAATYASQWGETHYVSGQKAIALMDEPTAASHAGKLYVMYRR